MQCPKRHSRSIVRLFVVSDAGKSTFNIGEYDLRTSTTGGDDIDFSRNQMYNNYRKSSSECELKYYENYA